MAAFYLEFLKHQFFRILGEVGLVQESRSEELGICFDEDVSTMETAEESDDGF